MKRPILSMFDVSKFIRLITLLAVVFASAACSGREAPDDVDTTPTPLPSPTSTSLIRGPCENVLFPIAPDRQWIYQRLGRGSGQTTPDPLTSRFGIAVNEIVDSQASLVSVDMSTGASIQTTVECQDGAITNFPLMVIGTIFGDYLSGDIHLEYVSGVFAPSQAELDASAWQMQWEGRYIAGGTVNLSAEGEQVNLTLEDSPIHMLWQTDGQESVTIPTGTYPQAYRITCTTELEATISFGDISGTGTFTLASTYWFAPYVGMLKTDVDSAALTIFGITIPIELNESVQLTEFRK